MTKLHPLHRNDEYPTPKQIMASIAFALIWAGALILGAVGFLIYYHGHPM